MLTSCITKTLIQCEKKTLRVLRYTYYSLVTTLLYRFSLNMLFTFFIRFAVDCFHAVDLLA